jgi:hypothetical protein
LNILDGNYYDGILRGNFKKFKNGESLPIKLIENGLLKDKPGLD